MTKTISYVVGAVLAIVGIIGSFSDPVLGIFEVNTNHNLVLIVLGVVLLLSAWQDKAAMGAKIVGIVTAIIAVLGYIPPMTSALGFIETNLASSLLHTVAALVLLYAGFMAKEETSSPAPAPQQMPAQETMQQGQGSDQGNTV